MRGARARPPVSIQEHMAIDVCPGPIRPIRRISDYFPRRPDIWTQCSGGLGPQAPGGASQGLARRTSTKDDENGDDIRDHIEDSGEEDDDEEEEEHEDVDEVFGAYAEATKAMTPRMEKKTSVGSTSWNNPLLSPRGTQASHHSLLVDPGDPDDSDDTCPGSSFALLGELEFRLMYDANSHILHCHILRAQALNVPDAAGHVDPYVKLHLLPGASRATKLRTRTVHGTNDPCWNESLTYLGITDVDMETRTLRLSVCDEDKLGPNVCIGETRVPLRRLRPQQSRTFSVCLEHPLPRLIQRLPTFPKLERRTAWPEERGRILISLCFVPACSTVSTRAPFSTNQSLATRSTLSAHSGLHVCIVRCAHLAAMDPNGYSDPYVKLLLGPGLGRLGKRKTVVKKRTLNPEFVQEFIFEFQAAELKQRWLQVMVWDYDVARFDDFIGGVVLGMGTQGEARTHWLDCLRQPGDVAHLLGDLLHRSGFEFTDFE